MAGEAASALGLSMAVLAERHDDAACEVAAEVMLGSPLSGDDLRAFARRCGVVTFDHEQVDLEAVAALSDEGAVVRPDAAALELAVDKAHMRTVLDAAGVPVPEYAVIDNGAQASDMVANFAAVRGWPVMVKAARGGYDGKGVWPVAERAEAQDVLSHIEGRIVVEELVLVSAELAVMVARRPSGAALAWPAVETAQLGGVCREVLVPGRLAPDVLDAASALGQKVAEIAGAVGVMAVELFWSEGRLLVNEVATRPHNSGHWTIEGAETSQFENHVRAVGGLPLGTTGARGICAMVNCISTMPDRDAVLRVPGAHLHDYGKQPRVDRKLGHVTIVASDATALDERLAELRKITGFEGGRV